MHGIGLFKAVDGSKAVSAFGKEMRDLCIKANADNVPLVTVKVKRCYKPNETEEFPYSSYVEYMGKDGGEVFNSMPDDWEELYCCDNIPQDERRKVSPTGELEKAAKLLLETGKPTASAMEVFQSMHELQNEKKWMGKKSFAERRLFALDVFGVICPGVLNVFEAQATLKVMASATGFKEGYMNSVDFEKRIADNNEVDLPEPKRSKKEQEYWDKLCESTN